MDGHDRIQHRQAPPVPHPHLGPAPMDALPQPSVPFGMPAMPPRIMVTPGMSVPACNYCRKAHTACDPNRPCGRCVRTGRAHLCADPPPRKRGRRPLRETQAGSSGTTTTTTTSASASASADPEDAVQQQKQMARLNQLAAPQHAPHLPPQHAPQYAAPSAYPSQRQQQRRPYPDSVHPDRSAQASASHPHQPLSSPAFSVQRNAFAFEADHQTIKDERNPYPMPAAHYGHNHYPSPTGAAGQTSRSAQAEKEVRSDEFATSKDASESLATRLAVLSQVVEMQRGEIRQLRNENAMLSSRLEKKKTALKRARQQLVDLLEKERKAEEERKRRKRRKLEDQLVPLRSGSLVSGHICPVSTTTTTCSSPFSSPSSSSSPQAISATSGILAEARQHIPFINEYDVTGPLAVINFSYPIAAYMLPKISDDTPPTCVYASQAFCHLVDYPWDQLIGSPYTFTFVVNTRQYRQALFLATNRPPMCVSEVYRYHSLLRLRTGKLLRVAMNAQFFCNQQGRMQYTLLCIVDWEEGILEEGETPDKWTPLMRDIELEHSSPPSSSSSSSSNGPISTRDQTSSSSATSMSWASEPFQPTAHLNQPMMRPNVPLPPHMPYGPPQFPAHAHPRSWTYRHDYRQDPHPSSSLALQPSAGMPHHLITTADQISVMIEETRTNNDDASEASMSLSVPTTVGRRSSDMTSLLTLMLDSPSPTDTQGWPSPPF